MRMVTPSKVGITEMIDARSKAPSPAVPAIAYCQGTPLRNEIEQRTLVEEVVKLVRNSFAISWLDEPERKAYLQRLDDWVARHEA